jgi:hypothetical protein
MTVRLVYRAGGGVPSSPRSDSENQSGACWCAWCCETRAGPPPPLSCVVVCMTSVHVISMRPRAGEKASSGNFQFDDGTHPETRVMVFRRCGACAYVCAYARLCLL